VVFVAFMLTDPRTTPSNTWQQVVFGIMIALGASWMDRAYGFRVQHLFMVLFALSPWISYLTVKSSEKQKTFFVSLALFLLAISVIIFIESQPPYYFEMDG
jgi:Na+-translocating ferredoxin:NAD+ oxidoreductase RnfD subunit